MGTLADGKHFVQHLGFKPSNIIPVQRPQPQSHAVPLTKMISLKCRARSPRGQLLLSPAVDLVDPQIGPGSSYASGI
ncbi:hypothetical protein BD414DRAFT_497908 [Trametes punicea]|nr:hypothetical protein BD414DRAFT_497908 [Trametes punicea]